MNCRLGTCLNARRTSKRTGYHERTLCGYKRRGWFKTTADAEFHCKTKQCWSHCTSVKCLIILTKQRAKTTLQGQPQNRGPGSSLSTFSPARRGIAAKGAMKPGEIFNNNLYADTFILRQWTSKAAGDGNLKAGEGGEVLEKGANTREKGAICRHHPTEHIGRHWAPIPYGCQRNRGQATMSWIMDNNNTNIGWMECDMNVTCFMNATPINKETNHKGKKLYMPPSCFCFKSVTSWSIAAPSIFIFNERPSRQKNKTKDFFQYW